MHNNNRVNLPIPNIILQDLIIQDMMLQVYTSEKLRNKRNCMIRLCFVQIFSAFTGFVLYALRKTRITLVVHIVALLLALWGLFGAARCQPSLSLIHSIVTSGVLGSFFCYQILDALFRRKSDVDPNRLDETWILLIFSLPYLIDFCWGIYGGCFAVTMLEPEDNDDEERKIIDNPNDQEIELYHKNSNASEMCWICLERPRNAAFYPCGHVVTSFEWGTTYINTRKRGEKKWIVCRKDVENVIRLYNS